MNASRRRPSPTPWAGRLHDFGFTDVGAVRASNEDALVLRPADGLWAVADGMGGHRDGALASATLAAALGAAPIVGRAEADRASIDSAIQRANLSIFQRGAAGGGRTGSTIVTLLIGGDRFDVAWVGDSRAYVARAGVLHLLSTDHTQVQARVERGLLTPAEARSHPLAHVLTRAVGSEALVEISRIGGPVVAGDRFLLCSDGVHGVVGDAEIAEALSFGDPACAGEALASLCNARGSPDNFTLIIVDCA
jgi:serine/threonine protein phosphatase PrpC